jgi:AcrR family transcriptional regulator
MKNTKEKILHTARLLFNEFGYNQVTIRMIALKLNMSSGNLNYHYKKREDILEALYFEMVVVFDERVERLNQGIMTFKRMKFEIKTSMERMVLYRFFWTDLYNLLLQNKAIKRHFESKYEARIKGYQLLFQMLQVDSLLKKESFPKEYSFLIERMISFSNTWLYASSLYQNRLIDEEYIEQQANNLLAMLFPYLTESGKAEFEKVVLSM